MNSGRHGAWWFVLFSLPAVSIEPSACLKHFRETLALRAQSLRSTEKQRAAHERDFGFDPFELFGTPPDFRQSLIELSKFPIDSPKYAADLAKVANDLLGQTEIAYQAYHRVMKLLNEIAQKNPSWEPAKTRELRTALINKRRRMQAAPFKSTAFKGLSPLLQSDLDFGYVRGAKEAALVEGAHLSGKRMCEIYGKWWEEEDPRAKSLVHLGWSVNQLKDGQVVLLPPPNIETIFIRANQKIDALVREEILGEDEVVRPTLAFKKNDETIFVRPGIDPWPEDDWQLLLEIGQLSHHDFYAAVDEGKLPMGLAGFFLHDLGHLIDLLENSENMRAWRGYARSLKTNGSKPERDEKSEWRSAILSEFFAVPDISKEKKIREALPHFFNESGNKSVSEEIAALRKLDRNALHSRADRVASLADSSLIWMGGGMKDGYNEKVHDCRSFRIGRLLWSIQNEGPLPLLRTAEFQVVDVPNAARETLVALRDDIRMLVELRDDFDGVGSSDLTLLEGGPYVRDLKYYSDTVSSNPQQWKKVAAMDPAVRAKRIDELLFDRISRLEMAFHRAVALKITPTQVIKDARNQEPPQNSPTFKYLGSYSPPGSFTREAFALDRKPAPN